MTLESSNSEKRNLGSVDDAVEYINQRPSENFVIYDATKDIVDEINRRVKNTVTQG